MKRNYLLKKSGVVGIIIIFICASFVSSIGGYSEDASQVDIDIEDVCEFKEDVLVTCSTFGFPGEPSQETSMSQSDAESLYDKIKDLQIEIARDPLSDKTRKLQHEIITLADKHNLLPAGLSMKTLKSRLTPTLRPQHPKLKLPRLQNQASEMFCNYVSTGSGSALPIIILPRLIPILLTPIPRLFVRWSTLEGVTSCGGLRSGTGFIATGAQNGIALGFWGIGFSIFLPPVMAYGLFGYALFASVNAEEIELWPPNYPPEITVVSPLNGAENIPVSTSELRFQISDFNGDPMSYSVTTTPDIGSGSGDNKPDGTYTVPISGLEGSEEYTWHVQVSDGENIVDASFTFTTEPVAPIVSDPSPEDGARYVPIDPSQLSFRLSDPQGDLMDYTVETSPDIGSGSGSGVGDGTYTVDVSGLEYSQEYKWFVNVTDGVNWKHKVFSFQVEHKMIFNPFDEGWQYRKNITIDHTKVAGDFLNFPALISTTDSDLRDKAQIDGDDILFMDGTGVATRLYHEIEQFDGSSGELVAWVNVTDLTSNQDTTLYMYYGNPTASNQESPTLIWDTGFTHVWHMDGTDDSTSNNHDLTNHGATITTGIIGSAYDFEKSETDYLTYGDNTISHPKPMCMELWFSMESTATGDYYGMMSMRDQYAIDLIQRKNAYTTVPDNCIYGGYKDISSGWNFYDTGAHSISTNTWYYIAFTVDGSGNAQIFFDGIGKESGSGLGDAKSTDWESGIGAYFSSSISHHFDGIIDEVRISDVTRSAEWVSTSYNNQNDPSSFLSFGPEETGL